MYLGDLCVVFGRNDVMIQTFEFTKLMTASISNVIARTIKLQLNIL